MNIDFKLLGKRIQEVRKAKKVKQMGLARMTGLSEQYISQVETGRKQISLQGLLQIAEALDVTADTLLVGNQKAGKNDYDCDINAIISDCNLYERKIVCGIARETKRLLKENKFFRK
ncbi:MULTISPECIES: helix-turn-helix domain-containing protein [unclassified Butyrivibrio]|uniref:helix-turn-helix domain-containing protein n=1 Tax=unclassified Butyrivibrio TaxID=2639466 RepID=UPI0008765D8A|nr:MULTISPECIES: helix-turn-helix transcriptional regulator [unclassified Butyrivibrio]SCY14623.1 Helix-turn-helix domain-containing protein [Butyrivibrio sp. INlla14]SDB52094.1 Helix-turn-helix domain-containing protein [Butyrivibrio sp. INlla16]